MTSILSPGRFRIQNVGYQESFLAYEGGVVVGFPELVDAHIEWNLEIINPVDPEIKLTIMAFDGRYLGADSNGVVLIDRLFEWIGSYHGDGWFFRDPSSKLGLHLPDGEKGTKVVLVKESTDIRSLWYFR
ncbi:hypothetical protein M405DRAFT_816624 [Rhizopogon salebrosus TDB-379]|nr:hypothetical protein M405DRAFT_816624 [Rhizopogon salebrosus TDB-379]